MKRRSRMKKILTLALIFCLFIIIAIFTFTASIVDRTKNKVLEHSPYEISQKNKLFHDSMIIMDWHSDSLLWDRNLLEKNGYGHMDIPRLIEANIAIQMFTAVTKFPYNHNYKKNAENSDIITLLTILQLWPTPTWTNLLERALYQSHKLHQFASKAPNKLKIVKNKRNLKKALEERAIGKQRYVTALLGIEGLHVLAGDLENIQTLFAAGYRMFGLHHLFDNKIGGSLHGITKAGLSDFGRKVVQRLNELNVIIDVAHSSPAVVKDVLDISNRPAVISHTGLYGVCQSPRNIPDKLIKRIAEKGGIIAIGYWQAAVCDINPKGIIKTLRYAIDLVGEDNVVLGSDFDGTITTTFDASELAVLTEEMLNSGFTKTQIRKIMGENSVTFLQKYLPE